MAPINPMYEIPNRLTVCPPINEPKPIPKLNIPEKIDIATALLSLPWIITSDCAATLNALEVHPQQAHTINKVINVIEHGFNKTNTSAIALVKILINSVLFLE